MSQGTFAIIIPAFNEEPNMKALVQEMHRLFGDRSLKGEVILVDDGSTDGTALAASHEIAGAEIAGAGWQAFRVLRHRRNFGKSEAIVTAAAATSADVVVVYDADMQHAVDEIPRFLAKIAEGYDIVTGRKIGRYDKRVVSSLYNRLSRSIFHIGVTDMNSMKAFRTEILREVHLRHDWHRFFVVLAVARGYTATEIDIELLPRTAGTSKYSGKSRILVGLMDLLSVWFYLAFAKKPMLLFGISGLLSTIMGFAAGLTAIVLRTLHIVPPFGLRPMLNLVVLLEVTGCLLIGFGFIGEMLAQQHAEAMAAFEQAQRGNR